MTWQARAGQSTIIPDSGSVSTIVQISDGAGHVVTPAVANDGTVAGLTAAVKAIIAMRDPVNPGQRLIVPFGTVLDLIDPPPPTPAPDPTPPPPTAQDTFRAAYVVWRQKQRAVAEGWPGVAQADVDTARATANAAYQAGFDAILPL